MLILISNLHYSDLRLAFLDEHNTLSEFSTFTTIVVRYVDNFETSQILPMIN